MSVDHFDPWWLFWLFLFHSRIRLICRIQLRNDSILVTMFPMGMLYKLGRYFVLAWCNHSICACVLDCRLLERSLRTPQTFRSRLRNDLAKVLETWKQSGPCKSGSNEKYLRKHWFRIRTTDGLEMEIYFDRQARSKHQAKKAKNPKTNPLHHRLKQQLTTSLL